MNPVALGKKVSKRREKLGLSQQDLAGLANISRNYISLIERGDAKNISTAILNKLALALDLSPNELLNPSIEHEELLIPDLLRKIAIEENLSFATVETLSRIPKRGKEPQSEDDWRKLYESIKDFLGDN